MKAPFYKVWIKDSGRDVTEYVTSLVEEDCLNEDDLVEIKMQQKSITVIDDVDFLIGNVLQYKFGFIAGAQSAVKDAEITEIACNYTSSVSLTIKCLDKGNTMKKVNSGKIWKGKTASQIVTEIGAKYGLAATNVEATKRVFTSLAQGQMSDWDFCHYITDREESGNFIFYVKGKEIVLKKRDLLTTEPVKTFVWGVGNEVISFAPRVTDATKSGAKDKTSLKFTDPSSGQVTSQDVTDGSVTDDDRLGINTVSRFDNDGNRIKTDTGDAIITPTLDAAQAKALANKKKKDADLEAMTADLVTELNPTIKAGDLITMKGVGQRHIGNWQVTKARHDGKGISTFTMAKNATALPIKTGADKAANGNKQIGADDKAQTVNLHRYSNDGVLIKK